MTFAVDPQRPRRPDAGNKAGRRGAVNTSTALAQGKERSHAPDVAQI